MPNAKSPWSPSGSGGPGPFAASASKGAPVISWRKHIPLPGFGNGLAVSSYLPPAAAVQTSSPARGRLSPPMYIITKPSSPSSPGYQKFRRSNNTHRRDRRESSRARSRAEAAKDLHRRGEQQQRTNDASGRGARAAAARALPRRRGVGGGHGGARPPPLRARARARGGARARGAHPARGEAARRRAAVDGAVQVGCLSLPLPSLFCRCMVPLRR